MSSILNVIANLELVTDYSMIYVGLFIFTCGLIGNILNIIVFLSLQTFRRNPCAFCLLVLSISDIGTLLFFALPVTFANILKSYGGSYAVFPCKPRMGLANIFVFLSNSIVSIAAIDQYLSTSMPDRHHGINIKIMQYLVIAAIVISVLYGIPFFIYYDVEPLSAANGAICRINDNNGAFSIYAIYVSLPVVDGLLPVTIMSTFGVLALRNVRNMSKTRVHIIRLRLEQQLTAMVLTKILSVAIIAIPVTSINLITYTVTNRIQNNMVQRLLIIAFRLITLFLYVNYAVSSNSAAW